LEEEINRKIFKMNESTSKNNGSTIEPLKIIILGDSAVGKSKLLERFLINS
jgi:GTPase SAR1 family protein